MSWQERIQEELIFTTPSGTVFQALWRGDTREREKKVGIFEYPLVNGAVTQDLDSRATRHPFSFYFESTDHDLIATRFYDACNERGPWQVDHPTKGRLRLQLLSVKEEIAPVESANVTAFSTEWIESINDTLVTVSIPQRVAAVRERAQRVYQDILDPWRTPPPVFTKPSALTAFRNACKAAAATVKATLAPLTRTVGEVNAAVESVHRGVTNATTSAVLDVVALGGQIQALIALPALVKGDLITRLGYYKQLLAGVGLPVGAATPAGVSVLMVRELVAVTALAAAAEVIIDGDPATREEALQLLETFQQMHTDLTVSLDAGQSLYADQLITQRYFNQSEAELLVADVTTLLLRRLFDLAVAKRFTLQRNRAPVEIAITEGVDLDLFIASNGLTGRDILLLPAGREVVVYL